MLRYILVFLSMSIATTAFAQNTYYISSSQGNDSNSGTQTSPWKTLSKINDTNLNPGDQVLFKSGDTWNNEQIVIDRSGNQDNYITFSLYGTGTNPILSGNTSITNVLKINSGVKYIIIDGISFKNISTSGVTGIVLGEQGAQHITITNCDFSQSETDVSQWIGMIFAKDPAYWTIENCDFTGGVAGINLSANYGNSHNDGHHITINNNNFHRISTRADENNLTGASARSNGIWFQQWFQNNPDIEGLPGTILGQEGTFRDITITNNRFDSLHNAGIYWYRDRQFYTSYSTSGTPPTVERPGYHWYVQNNTFNLTEGAAIELAPISNRWGQNHPETGQPIQWSIISGNVIDSAGYNYISKIGGNILVNAIESHGWKQLYIEDNKISWVTSINGDGHGFNFDYSPALSDNKIFCDSLVVRRNMISYCINNDYGTPANWGNFNYNSYGTTSGAGIQFYTANQNCEVYDNIIWECNYGISYINSSISRSNHLIYNNTIYSCDFAFKGGTNDGTAKYLVKNNIFAYNRIKGFWATSSSAIYPPTNFDFNLYYGNQDDYQGNVIPGINDITGNPMFADTAAKDFRLTDGSSAINNGIMVNLNVPIIGFRIIDMFGNIVPFDLIPDVGAFEFGSSTGGNSTNVNIRILLEGSFNGVSMITNLLNGGHIPLTQPYNQAPWNYNGTETVTNIPSGVVDWVLLELRSGTASSSTVARKAALIKSDGIVVDLDGVSPVSFNEISGGNYYIVIKHRNHISIMSTNAVSLSSNSSLYDFTTGSDKAFGLNSLQNLGNGKWGMYAGDGDFNGLINVIDYGIVGNHLFETGYKFGDIDMNGIVNVIDYAKTNLNLFKTSQVPN